MRRPVPGDLQPQLGLRAQTQAWRWPQWLGPRDAAQSESIRLDRTYAGPRESSLLSPPDMNEGRRPWPRWASRDCQSEVVERGVTRRTRRTATEKEKQPRRRCPGRLSDMAPEPPRGRGGRSLSGPGFPRVDRKGSRGSACTRRQSWGRTHSEAVPSAAQEARQTHARPGRAWQGRGHAAHGPATTSGVDRPRPRWATRRGQLDRGEAQQERRTEGMKTRVTGSPVTGRIKGGRRAAGGSGRPGLRERGFRKPPRALARPRLRTAFSDFPGSGLENAVHVSTRGKGQWRRSGKITTGKSRNFIVG